MDADALCVGKKRRRASAQNKADAEAYCKRWRKAYPGEECKVDKRACPRGYKAKKKYRGCGINYSACVKRKPRCRGAYRRAQSAKNRRQARAFCARYQRQHRGSRCIVDKRICPRGYVAERKFRGCGTNYSACVKGRKWTRGRRKRRQGKAAARKWCREFRKLTGQSCRYVKTRQRCPRGYRKFGKLKNRNVRNMKICVRGKKSFWGHGQRVHRNCDARSAAYIKIAADWLATHYDALTGDFKLHERRGKDRRIRRRLERKFRNVKAVCYPRNTSDCKSPGLRGRAKGHQRYKVHLCLRRLGSLCGLVGTLFHEVAHKARVPKSKIHNDADNPDRLKDHVYRIGFKARDACKEADMDMEL